MTQLVLVLVLMVDGDPPEVSVEQLIRNLGDKEYRVRERATRELIGRGDSALAEVTKAANTSDDAEVRMRAGVVVTRLNSIRWQAAQRRVDEAFTDFPYIDALWYNVEKKSYDSTSTFVFRWCFKTFSPYLEHARHRTHVPPTCVLYKDTRSYAEYRRASRHMAIVAVYNGVPISTLKDVFKIMHERDKLFYPRSVERPPSYVEPVTN